MDGVGGSVRACAHAVAVAITVVLFSDLKRLENHKCLVTYLSFG